MYIVYVFGGIGENLLLLKRVNAHANGVNYLLQFLQYSSNSPIIQIQESKSGYSSYMSFILSLSQPIGITVFRVQHLLFLY